MSDKITTFEPFKEEKDGYTQIGIKVKNPPEWMINRAKGEELRKAGQRAYMNRIMFGEVAE